MTKNNLDGKLQKFALQLRTMGLTTIVKKTYLLITVHPIGTYNDLLRMNTEFDIRNTTEGIEIWLKKKNNQD